MLRLVLFLLWMRIHRIPPHSIPSCRRSQDTSACDEQASPHVLIDVLISLMGVLRGQQKAPAGGEQTCRGCVWCLRVR
jgi:hypothetical protein